MMAAIIVATRLRSMNFSIQGTLRAAKKATPNKSLPFIGRTCPLRQPFQPCSGPVSDVFREFAVVEGPRRLLLAELGMLRGERAGRRVGIVRLPRHLRSRQVR